jgi:hypothetical protein
MVSISTLSICIITPDLRGLVRNGGVGTACAELALALSSAGHKVSVLFTQTDVHKTPASELERVCRDYETAGIGVVIAEQWARSDAILAAHPSLAEGRCYPDHSLLRMSRIVHDW